DDFQKVAGGIGIVGNGVEEGFGVSLNGGERGAQLVGDVSDKIAASFLYTLGLGEIAENGDGATIGQGSGGDVESAAGNNGSGAGCSNFFARGSGFNGGEEIGIANGLDDRRIETSALRHQAVHGLIGPADES